MARHARLTATGWPHLVAQRALDGVPVFRETVDRRAFLEALAMASSAHAVVIHAYSLADDGWMMLATPGTDGALSRWVQDVGRRFGRNFNARRGRRGPLWDGRFQAAVLQPAPWVLDAMVYMDLHANPSATSGAEAAEHRSSHAHHVGHHVERFLTPHAQYWALGNTPFAREAAYAARVRAGLSVPARNQLADAARSGWALGDEAFLSDLTQLIGRRVQRGVPGRPRKQVPSSNHDGS